jgi:hypothetical protein
MMKEKKNPEEVLVITREVQNSRVCNWFVCVCTVVPYSEGQT